MPDSAPEHPTSQPRLHAYGMLAAKRRRFEVIATRVIILLAIGEAFLGALVLTM
jgi:hypothetical protein